MLALIGVLASAAPAVPPGLRRGMALLALLAGLGLAVVLGVAVLASLRRGRMARRAAAARRSEAREAGATGWDEAGRRARPEDGDHWLPGDEDYPTKQA